MWIVCLLAARSWVEWSTLLVDLSMDWGELMRKLVDPYVQKHPTRWLADRLIE